MYGGEYGQHLRLYNVIVPVQATLSNLIKLLFHKATEIVRTATKVNHLMQKKNTR